MTEHTKGRLHIATETGPCVVATAEREICECYEDGELQTSEDEANARRLVACWNACDGIPTEDLEQKVAVEFLTSDHDRPRDKTYLAQRARPK